MRLRSCRRRRPDQVLAANQGLCIGWTLWLGSEGRGVQVFFLLCVLVAGVFGAVTASRKILFIQGLPALVGLGLLWAAT